MTTTETNPACLDATDALRWLRSRVRLRPGRTLVGIDGPEGSGKDGFAEELAALLADGRRLTCQHPVPLDEERFVVTAPDLIITDHRGRTELVADVKYKLTADGTGRSSDYYQLLAYCTSLALPRGVLIYADAGDLPAPRRRLHVRNAGTRLDTVRLSLHGSPEELDARVGVMVTELLLGVRSA